MSQHDYGLDNQTFPASRTDLNNLFSAILTKNSGASAPTTTGQFLEYVNTTDHVIYRRNSGDSAWYKIDSSDDDRVLSKTSNYTVVIGDYGKTILCDASGGSFTITLPAAASAGDRFPLKIKKIDSSSNTVTIDGNSSETIDGALSVILNSKNQSIEIDCDNTNWQIISANLIASYEDSRTNSVVAPFIVQATTSGTPAAGIGVGIKYQAESGDETPSDFGQIQFAASDVTAGSEDTYFEILTRRAGAALAAAYRWIVTSSSKYIFTGAPSADRTITLPDTDISNFVVQRVYTQTGAVATGTTTIPDDDTIPQNTEGDQYMSLSITPKNANNILEIKVTGFWHNSSGNAFYLIAALFQDTTVNALAAAGYILNSPNANNQVTFTHTMTAGTTSATTFKLRAGGTQPGTTTLNGIGGARRFGGTMASSMVITEYSA